MAKLIDKIKAFFKTDKEYMEEHSTKVVGTWLAQDDMKREEKQKVEKKEHKKEEPQDFEKIVNALSGAKRKFTDDEFADRKKEVLKFLDDLKKKNKG